MSEETDQIYEIPIHDGNKVEEGKGETTSSDVSSGQTMTNENLGSIQKEQENHYDQLMRLRAEFQNYRRRNEQRMRDWQESAGRDIIAQILPIIDDFDILFGHHADESAVSITEGVRFIFSKLTSTLKDLGLEMIPTDVSFDPQIHDAVMTEHSSVIEEGKIIRVWQKGYLYKGVLLRPAKVIIAKRDKI